MAKKSRRRSEKVRPKSIRKKLRQRTLLGEREVIVESRSGDDEKMSEVLADFAEPYAEYAETREAYENLIMTASMAWNAAILPKWEARMLLLKTTRTIRADAGLQAADDFKAIVDDLIQRKKRYFAENKRLILNFEVSETKHEYRLSVLSTPA